MKVSVPTTMNGKICDMYLFIGTSCSHGERVTYLS
jgi:hypothetical protein